MLSVAIKTLSEEKINFQPSRKHNVVKTINEKKDNETFDMDDLHRIIKKLSNDIIDLKRNAGESSSSRRVWKNPFR